MENKSKVKRRINLKLSDREWICKSCGSIIDRDYNAAKNIRDEGIRIVFA
jgi:putative transposase